MTGVLHKYLVDATFAYWLVGATASHFDEIGTTDWHVLIKLKVHQSRVVMNYEDSNGHEHARLDGE